MRKPYGFLMLSGGRERVHWEQMGYSSESLLKRGKVFQWIDFVSVNVKMFPMKGKQRDNQKHNNLHTFHTITIFAVFKKLSEKKLQEQAFCV